MKSSRDKQYVEYFLSELTTEPMSLSCVSCISW